MSMNENTIDAELRFNRQAQTTSLWIETYQSYLNRVSGQIGQRHIKKAAELAEVAVKTFKKANLD